MSSFTVSGGRRLKGEAFCQGSKNSSLPILAASILSDTEVVLENIPRLSDVEATIAILRYLGCKIKLENRTVVIDPSCITASDIPEELMREMRSSVIFLGAVLARTGRAELFSPGGCEIGLRPIDLHLEAVRKLGAKISFEQGKIICSAPEGLKGAAVSLSFPSVGATENVMIAACLAEGRTEIHNAAREPEISDLADFLNAMGARIGGAGESTVVIDGVKKLRGARHTVIPDRIAGATLLAAAAITGGCVRVNGLIPAHLSPVIDIFEQAGNEVEIKNTSVTLRAPERLTCVKTVRTMPYPGFPTDIQPPVAAMLCRAGGVSVIIETIFENRFKYIGGLSRFGARVRAEGRMAVIEGTEKLYPAKVETPDLRGGAALVLAALSAEGESVISGVRHIDRGYEDLERTLSSLSAEIKRTD